MSWYLGVLKQYAQFNGRARRKEYWMFTLINMLIYLGLLLICTVAASLFARSGDPSAKLVFLIPAYIYILAVTIPNIAVAIRRLHDTGRSGWWLLVGFVPFIGGILMLIFMAQDGQPEPNLYGPNPKALEIYGQMNPAIPRY